MPEPRPPHAGRGAGAAGRGAAALVLLPGLGGCGEAPGAAAWGFAGLAFVAVAAVAYALGALRERHAAQSALRGARQDQHLLAGLVEGWTWQSDRSHRLLRLQPPAGAPAGEWRAGDDAGLALWDCFDGGDDAGLRQRLQAQAPFADLRVRRRSDGSGWRLRGAPRFADDGAFDGYAGTATATDADDARIADAGALQALMALLDAPLLWAEGDGTPAGWRLRHVNAEAARLLDAPAGPLAWPEALARLPAPVRNAVAESRIDAPAEHEGWRLRRFQAAGRAGLLLVKMPAADAAADGDAASLSFTVSHDLRAPVRVVEGFTRILKEDYGRLLDRVGNDHLDRVLGAAARMNHMIDALLTLAKLSRQPLARQPVNLSQLAAYVVDDLRRQAPDRAAEIEIEPGLAVDGDPTLLRLVLENLLGNAWKYTAKAKKARIVFAAERHDGRRAFVVRDNGAGFDMRSADRLFGLFQRLHSANDFPGTGVGLASVQRIVRRHGGEVWADAEPGRGAAFHFTLRE